jgi:ABC-type nickel/cobalt efflux system permease component RcnA
MTFAQGDRRRAAVFAALGFAAFCLMMAAASAQTPFGVPGPRSAPPTAEASGIGGWLLAQQAEFHRALTRALSAIRQNPSGVFALSGIAFAYGVLHAIGPGHGKAVIASYIVANEQTMRRGIALSFGAAAVQALVALLAVAILILIIGGTARNMENALLWIERAGFALIAALGLSILWRKARALTAPTALDSHCGHDHGPDAAVIARASPRDLVLTAIGAGLRPCTGAIILLVFALTQGLFWAGAVAVAVMALGTAIGTSLFAVIAVKAKVFALGLAAGRSRWSGRITLGVEALAGALLAALGVLLLTGTIGMGN